MVEQAVAGLATINSWTANSHTLTTANGTTSEARCAMLVAATGGGAPTAAAEIICPAASKLYILKNTTGYTVTLKTAAGSGVAVPNGDTAFLFCDGTNVNACITTVTFANGTANGVAYLNASKVLTSGSGLTYDGTALTMGANPTLSAGTANGVLYLNGSKVATSGSALTYNGTGLGVGVSSAAAPIEIVYTASGQQVAQRWRSSAGNTYGFDFVGNSVDNGWGQIATYTNGYLYWGVSATAGAYTELMRLTSDGLGIGGAPEAGIKLKLYGALKIQSAQPAYLMNSDNTNNVQIANAGATGATNGQMAFTLGAVGEGMRLTSTGLGIGTSSPGAKLQVNGGASPSRGIAAILSASVTGAQLQFTQGSVDDWAIGQPAGTSAFAFWSGRATGSDGTERMRLDSSGNLGLGVTPGAWGSNSKAFEVAGAAAGHVVAYVNQLSVGRNYYQTNTDIFYAYTGQSAQRLLLTNDGQFQFFTAPSGTAGNAISFTQAMTLDASGNLLVGKTSSYSGFRLQVNNGNGYAVENSAGTGQAAWFGAGGNVGLSSGNAAVINGVSGVIFGVNSVESMRLDSSGNLGLGVTPSASTSTVNLQVKGTAVLIGNSSGAEGAYLTSNAIFNSGWKYISTAAASRYDQGLGAHAWFTAPSGTAGNAISFTQAMTLTSDGKLLVGTATDNANARVHFAGTTQSDNGINLSYFGVGSALIRIADGNNLTFGLDSAAGNTERMRLDSSGNLGLGVTPSAWFTDYRVMQIGLAGAVFNDNFNEDLNVSSNAYADTRGGYKFIRTGYAQRYTQTNSGQHQWRISTASGTAGNAISFTQAMTLDAGGRLLVGRTSSAGSQYSLELDNGSSDNRIGMYAGATLTGGLLCATNEIRMLGIGASTVLTFQANGQERARITSGGDLLVGTTDAAQTSGAGFKVGGAGGAGVGQVAIVDADSTNSTVTYRLYSTGAAAYRFYVGLGGTIYATNTTITAISDQRLKENIRDLDAGLSEVMALKPRKFDWKAGKGKDKKNDRGWIAQEFEQVFPDMVDTWQDPAPEGEEPYKAVNADLIPVLVKAMQEQQALIAALTARVAQLERQS
jgi:hypothetical protein